MPELLGADLLLAQDRWTALRVEPSTAIESAPRVGNRARPIELTASEFDPSSVSSIERSADTRPQP